MMCNVCIVLSPPNLLKNYFSELSILALTFEGFEINGPMRAQNDRLGQAIILSPYRTSYLEWFKMVVNFDIFPEGVVD